LLSPPIVQVLRLIDPDVMPDTFLFYSLKETIHDLDEAKEWLAEHPKLWVYLGTHDGMQQITLSLYAPGDKRLTEDEQRRTAGTWAMTLGIVGEPLGCFTNAEAWELAMAHAHMFTT
jgi:hypothetical protein